MSKLEGGPYKELPSSIFKLPSSISIFQSQQRCPLTLHFVPEARWRIFRNGNFTQLPGMVLLHSEIRSFPDSRGLCFFGEVDVPNSLWNL